MKRASTPTETPQVGRSIPRLEAWQKVTGRAEYVHNLRLPGMLYGKIFRSTVPHGRIRRIDVGAAQAVGGVYRVVTADDVRTIVPEPYYGPAFHDQPILAIDKVRYIGEPVAIVLAVRSARRGGGGAPHRRRVRGAARGLRRDRGDDLEGDRARGAQAGGHLPRPEAPQGPGEHERRARLPPAPRRCRAAHSRRPTASSSTLSARSR